MPVPTGSEAAAPIEERARSYMHVNCAFCHRPSGPGRGMQDLRIERTLQQTQLCNVTPLEGDLGVTGATLLAPGMPARSILSLRMHAGDSKRMPPLASLVTDDDGVELIDAWIRSLTACP